MVGMVKKIFWNVFTSKYIFDLVPITQYSSISKQSFIIDFSLTFVSRVQRDAVLLLNATSKETRSTFDVNKRVKEYIFVISGINDEDSTVSFNDNSVICLEKMKLSHSCLHSKLLLEWNIAVEGKWKCMRLLCNEIK